MKAICWQGKKDIRCEEVPDPIIQDPKDAIVRITSTCICGSDLHLMDGFVPTMCAGDVLGHEPMGEVVEVGAEAKARGVAVGDRVVVPFQMTCGECEQCRAGNFSVCQVTNRNADLAKAFSATRRRACSGTPTSPAATPAARPSTCAYRSRPRPC